MEIYVWCMRNKRDYYTSLSFFLYKNMTVVLLLHPKINCMTIPPVVPIKNCRAIPLCDNFSNHISRTVLNHSSHWFKLKDVICKSSDFFIARAKLPRRQTTSKHVTIPRGDFSNHISRTILNH